MKREDILTVHSPGLKSYVIRDSDGLYLLDGGFVGGLSFLTRALRTRGWAEIPIVGIVVTHGHLDHILNIARLAELHGAWVAAPALDLPHYRGEAAYSPGWNQVTRWLEMAGRPMLGFRPFEPDRLLHDGDKLEISSGLTVVHLPGHTAGHSGFFNEATGLLFCADLFASYGPLSHLPPSIFNLDTARSRRSVATALARPLAGVLPNHADGASPEEHLARLRRLGERISEKA